MKFHFAALIVATVSLASVHGGSKAVISASCQEVGSSIRSAVAGKSAEGIVKMVSNEVQLMPDCSCEIMKGAIKGSESTPTVVAAVVDAAIQSAPDRINDIVSCAIAAAPDAMNEILAVAEKYGWSPNPLDFPGLIGDPASQYLFVPTTPVFVNPPLVTLVDP